MLTVLGNSIALAAGPPRVKRAMDPVKLKEALTERGIGQGVRVEELAGTTEIGILAAIHDDTFEIAPTDEAKNITIQYAQVVSIHNTRHGMSNDAKVSVFVVAGLAVAAGVVAITILILRRH
jgi:hypothetical protein